ncbi:MAG: carboxypeptidase-like regulatory domain-containing protein [Candidatus Thorarchaeota archaeon]
MQREKLVAITAAIMVLVVLPVVSVIPVAAFSFGGDPACIVGTVRDSNGSTISGVTITVKIGGVVQYTCATDSSGRYTAMVTVSSYTQVSLTYSKAGYSTYATTAYVSPGYITVKDVTLGFNQGVKGSVYTYEGQAAQGIKVKILIGSTVIGTVYTNSLGKYSLGFYVASSSTVTLKFYRHGGLVETKTTTVYQNSWRTKDVTLPQEWQVTNKNTGSKIYEINVDHTNYPDWGITVYKMDISYIYDPVTNIVEFQSYEVKFSSTWDELYFASRKLTVYMQIPEVGDMYEYWFDKDFALGDLWDPGDQFSSGVVSIPYTHNGWVTPKITFEFTVKGILGIDSIYSMTIGWELTNPLQKWSEYTDFATRTWALWSWEFIFPPVVTDSWSPSIVTTSI